MSEYYVIVLLGYKDGSLVLSKDELMQIQDKIVDDAEALKKNDKPDRDGFSFRVKTNFHLTLDKNDSSNARQKDHLWTEAFFYHHRVILKFVFRETSSAWGIWAPFRERRAWVLRRADEIVKSTVAAVNSLLLRDGTATIAHCYRYLVVFDKSKLAFESRMENLLGSFSFQIVDKKGLYGRLHAIRVSLPCLQVLSTRRISRNLKADIINAVYSYLLYPARLKDEALKKRKVSQGDSGVKIVEFIDEGYLKDLWSYISAALGGTVGELQNYGLQKKVVFLTIVTIVLMVVQIALSL